MMKKKEYLENLKEQLESEELRSVETIRKADVIRTRESMICGNVFELLPRKRKYSDDKELRKYDQKNFKRVELHN